jgi:hypothetical protein
MGANRQGRGDGRGPVAVQRCRAAKLGVAVQERERRATVGWFWRALAAVIVAARYLILLAWIGAAAAVTLYLPPLNASSGVGGLIPSGAPALRAAYVNTPGERFGLETLALGALVLAVLQTDLKLKRDDHGNWRFELHKKAMSDSALARVLTTFIGHFGSPDK